MLSDTHQYINHLASPTFDTTDNQHAERTWAKYNTLAECFVKNRIYLEEETCKRIDDLLLKMRLAMTKSSIGQSREPGARGLELWHEAWKSITDEVPPILKELEREFRAFLKPNWNPVTRKNKRIAGGCKFGIGEIWGEVKRAGPKDSSIWSVRKSRAPNAPEDLCSNALSRVT